MSSCKTRDIPEEMSQEQKDAIVYYSKILNKYYESYEELKADEAEFKRQNDEKSKALEVKKTRAKEVEDAYLEYQKVKEEAYQQIAEAEKKWIELRDKFAEDYHGYHMTYVNNNGEKRITFNDLVNSFFTW